ncbi:MAG: hypothetical protein K0S61_2700 [Anaerocolumna sp.]|jgi:uncharacterized 2Fe-2S/4Fe-4S cluster protein (DUF4445 family)|nr:hypothetical protein [Anaerocolumna sp.]
MKDIVIKDDFHISIDQKTVLSFINLKKDSHNYREILEEYSKLEDVVLSTIKPKASIAFSVIGEECEEDILEVLPAGSRVLYSIITIGSEINKLYQGFIDNGEYVKGLLVDAMADSCLFAMEEDLKAFIKIECKKRGFGVCRRYEAPVDIPMKMQKVTFDETEAIENLGLTITRGFMLDPMKSCCQIFALTKDQVFEMDHNCDRCDNTRCQLRKSNEVKVIIVTKTRELELNCIKNESLLNAMVREGISFNAICGGNGLCGKCKVQLIEGELPITLSDEKYFTSRELSKGCRLACKAYPINNCKIAVEVEDENTFEILSDFKESLPKDVSALSKEYAIAVDIGTTTIAISLVELECTRIVNTYTRVNHQRLFGADVISRIKASNEGKRKELQKSICKDLLEGFEKIRAEIDNALVREIVIAGNTTMGHLLLGFNLNSLGVYPFKPVDISLIQKSYWDVFHDSYFNCLVTILPGISAFVGGDIVAGLYFSDFMNKDDINLFLDLGTNGEMAVGNREKLLVTSTAAGPAFEGGNITWGMGSVQGAISNATIHDGKVSYETIGGKGPIGICGTGVIAIMSELLKAGIVDSTGLLKEDYRREGYIIANSPAGQDITFTQNDIRELQLAKAAVRTGIEILLLRYGVQYENIDKVYLAGGFGYKIDQDKSINIGLLPKEFTGKIEAVGNTSLGGAIKYLKDNNAIKAFEQLKTITQEINLPMDEKFNDFYLSYIDF